MAPEIPTSTTALGKLDDGVGNLGLYGQEVADPDAGQVLLEVLAAGICGTDLHIADDEFPYRAPVTMGHEVTGTVISLGPGVDGSWLGKRVACETYFSYCEICAYCRSGRPNLCAERKSIGSYVNGGFARWMIVPERNLHELPERVGELAGALAEPLACVANCLFDPNVINPGDVALVAGPGPMGMLTAQAARAAGADVTIVGLDADKERLRVAEALGFAITTSQQTAISLEPEVFCECSGSAAAAAFGLQAVRKGGTFVQVGIFGRPVEVDFDQFLYKELTFASGNASTPRSWARAMALLHAGEVQVDPLISDVFPLSGWEDAFDATRTGSGLKSVLNPRLP